METFSTAWHFLKVANGEDGLHILRIAKNMLHEQSLTDDKGWFTRLQFERGGGAEVPHHEISEMLRNGSHRDSEMDRFFSMTHTFL